MFSAHWPLLSMVFRWFLGHSTITIKWFSAPRPLLSMVFRWFGGHSTIGFNGFNGHGPLVQRCDGFDGLPTSITGHIYQSSVFHFQSWCLSKLNVDNMDSSWVKYFLASMAAPPPQDGSSQGLGQEEEYNLSSTTIPWLDAFTDGT